MKKFFFFKILTTCFLRLTSAMTNLRVLSNWSTNDICIKASLAEFFCAAPKQSKSSGVSGARIVHGTIMD